MYSGIESSYLLRKATLDLNAPEKKETVTETYSKMIGIVLEKDGKYYLMNTMK